VVGAYTLPHSLWEGGVGCQIKFCGTLIATYWRAPPLFNFAQLLLNVLLQLGELLFVLCDATQGTVLEASLQEIER